MGEYERWHDKGADESVERSVGLLQRLNVTLQPGLSGAELITITRELGIHFPRDYGLLITQYLPSSHGFVNWRAIDDTQDIIHSPEDTYFRVHLRCFSVSAKRRFAEFEGHVVDYGYQPLIGPIFSRNQDDTLTFVAANLADYLTSLLSSEPTVD